MKHTIRSATGQYEFVETEIDTNDISAIGSNVALEAHHQVVAAMKGDVAGAGLGDNEFNGVIDVYLRTRQIPNGAEVYAMMSGEQQRVIQCIKRSFARTKNT